MDRGGRQPSLLPYLAIVGVYMIGLVVLKLVELLVLGTVVPNGRPLWVNAMVYNLVVASWTALGIGVLYWLIQLWSQKVARVVASVLLAVLLLTG